MAQEVVPWGAFPFIFINPLATAFTNVTVAVSGYLVAVYFDCRVHDYTLGVYDSQIHLFVA